MSTSTTTTPAPAPAPVAAPRHERPAIAAASEDRATRLAIIWTPAAAVVPAALLAAAPWVTR